ncbi:MAG: YaeQ family protein [Burkholderiaceae bacterium]
MALKATIFKAELQIADTDRHYYHEHALTIARHPSETDERMMVRLLAFARHADERLAFGKGLSDVDDPDLWQKDLTGAVELWIEVGLPDEKRILKACARAAQVVVYSYGATAALWWSQVAPKLERARNLAVWSLPAPATQALARLAQRTMRLQCSIDAGSVWLRDETAEVEIEPLLLRPAAPQ